MTARRRAGCLGAAGPAGRARPATRCTPIMRRAVRGPRTEGTMSGGASLHVCFTCRSVPSHRPRAMRATGSSCSTRCAASRPEGVALRPVECLANCARGCSAAISMPGKWSYLLGGLTPSWRRTCCAYAPSYAQSRTGTVMPSRRAASLRRHDRRAASRRSCRRDADRQSPGHHRHRLPRRGKNHAGAPCARARRGPAHRHHRQRVRLARHRRRPAAQLRHRGLRRGQTSSNCPMAACAAPWPTISSRPCRRCWTAPPPPEHILIETSGLALPKPLLKAFNWPDIRSRMTVDGVITVVDAPAVAGGPFRRRPGRGRRTARGGPAARPRQPARRGVRGPDPRRRPGAAEQGGLAGAGGAGGVARRGSPPPCRARSRS